MKKAIMLIILVLCFCIIVKGVFAEDWSQRHEDYYHNGTNYMADGINSSDIGVNGISVSDSDPLSAGGWTEIGGYQMPEYSNGYKSTGSVSMYFSNEGGYDAAGISLHTNTSFSGIIEYSIYCTSSSCPFGVYARSNGGSRYDHKFDVAGNQFRYNGYEADNSTWTSSAFAPVTVGAWVNFSYEYNESDYVTLSCNGTPVWRRQYHHEMDYIYFYVGDGVYYADNFWISNNAPRPTSVSDETPPSILTYNCTSCDIPNGDTTVPYETQDTTPTFRITTDESADCRIGAADQNYTSMGSSRDCATTGSTSHVCSLTVQDMFTSVGVNYLYMSCKDGSGNEGNATDPSKSTSGKVIMEILGAGETDAGGAIELGITTSEISGDVTIYSSQQVSARNLAANQFSGVFDKVAVSGNKRYAFNYLSEGESSITGLFNITPVLYVLQLQNQTNETITEQVGKLINDTYP